LFASSFIRNGRVRRWEMPDRTIDKLADYEVDDEGNEFMLEWQSEIEKALAARWDGAVKRTLGDKKRRQRKK